MSKLISFTDMGLYCKQGNFYIDPWKPVEFAIITHGHSDHARPGHQHYLCHTLTKPILQLRLGQNNYQTLEWNETIFVNGVKISLHPAGHIIGSSQVRIEYKGEVWVFTGDYKTEDDGISGQYEAIRCNTFITESTFGLPIYKWKTQQEIYGNIQDWVLQNQQDDKASVLIAYSLGKAQRLMDAVKNITDTVYVHGAIYNMQQLLDEMGYNFVQVKRISSGTTKQELKNAIVIAPPSADGTPWMKKLNPYRLGICSGWMQVRGNVRRRNADIGFALSDHCDWEGLLSSITATGAENVYVTHGFQSVLSKYLNEQGIAAWEVKTQYGAEDDEQPVTDHANSTEP
ncbi:ligase-associated DNA damage response exonuclease [Flavihumibacter profundi]|uniref:ligase-associated DNA damage response exonuclease n=1 Tax=Flavihumibacter profundi TaxID=2716883 RepID=UPI001CC410B1|nr:ligase-associated DNA damage response exonuclease [Flavihumibacter profundi]MBZ5857600.1 ligase-associated DNA damage response exonuclease [Flavihumibacter profundi]